MDSFSPRIAPDSLENILSTLETLIDHNHQPHHDLSNSPYQTIYEPFSNQPAEQYDDPLFLEEIAPSPVSIVVVKKSIPVLRNVVHAPAISNTVSNLNVEKTLNELRAELNEIVSDIMLDARDHLEQQDADSQEIMKTSLKQFLHDLTTRLPQ